MGKGPISGIILISAVVTVDGKLDEFRIVKSFDSEVDRASIATLQKWLVEPARNAEGSPVPVRIPFEVGHKTY